MKKTNQSVYSLPPHDIPPAKLEEVAEDITTLMSRVPVAKYSLEKVDASSAHEWLPANANKLDPALDHNIDKLLGKAIDNKRFLFGSDALNIPNKREEAYRRYCSALITEAQKSHMVQHTQKYYVKYNEENGRGVLTSFVYGIAPGEKYVNRYRSDKFYVLVPPYCREILFDEDIITRNGIEYVKARPLYIPPLKTIGRFSLAEVHKVATTMQMCKRIANVAARFLIIYTMAVRVKTESRRSSEMTQAYVHLPCIISHRNANFPHDADNGVHVLEFARFWGHTFYNTTTTYVVLVDPKKPPTKNDLGNFRVGFTTSWNYVKDIENNRAKNASLPENSTEIIPRKPADAFSDAEIALALENTLTDMFARKGNMEGRDLVMHLHQMACMILTAEYHILTKTMVDPIPTTEQTKFIQILQESANQSIDDATLRNIMLEHAKNFRLYTTRVMTTLIERVRALTTDGARGAIGSKGVKKRQLAEKRPAAGKRPRYESYDDEEESPKRPRKTKS